MDKTLTAAEVEELANQMLQLCQGVTQNTAIIAISHALVAGFLGGVKRHPSFNWEALKDYLDEVHLQMFRNEINLTNKAHD